MREESACSGIGTNASLAARSSARANADFAGAEVIDVKEQLPRKRGLKRCAVSCSKPSWSFATKWRSRSFAGWRKLQASSAVTECGCAGGRFALPKNEAQAGMKKAPVTFVTEAFLIQAWCPRRDSNPHTLRHMDLNHARLPIPPRGLEEDEIIEARQKMSNNSSKNFRARVPFPGQVPRLSVTLALFIPQS